MQRVIPSQTPCSLLPYLGQAVPAPEYSPLIRLLACWGVGPEGPPLGPASGPRGQEEGLPKVTRGSGAGLNPGPAPPAQPWSVHLVPNEFWRCLNPPRPQASDPGSAAKPARSGAERRGGEGRPEGATSLPLTPATLRARVHISQPRRGGQRCRRGAGRPDSPPPRSRLPRGFRGAIRRAGRLGRLRPPGSDTAEPCSGTRRPCLIPARPAASPGLLRPPRPRPRSSPGPAPHSRPRPAPGAARASLQTRPRGPRPRPPAPGPARRRARPLPACPPTSWAACSLRARRRAVPAVPAVPAAAGARAERGAPARAPPAAGLRAATLRAASVSPAAAGGRAGCRPGRRRHPGPASRGRSSRRGRAGSGSRNSPGAAGRGGGSWRPRPSAATRRGSPR